MFDGSLQSAFRIIAETRIQLEENAQVRQLEELETHLSIIQDTVMVSKVRAYSNLSRQQKLEEAV